MTTRSSETDRGIHKESDMSGPVMHWLITQGFMCYAEVPWRARKIDMCARKKKEDDSWFLICIEMKMSLSKAVVCQAQSLRNLTPNTYIVVHSNPRDSSLDRCRKRGLGVIRVADKDTMEILLYPKKMFEPCQKISMRNLAPGGLAGVANEKGKGPARTVLSKVNEYMKDHPGADWNEVYQAVPNHYAHARSMALSMDKCAKFNRLPFPIRPRGFGGMRRVVKRKHYRRKRS